MTRVNWSDIAKAARETSEALNGKDWVSASIKARVLLADLADEVERLTAERDAKMSRPAELFRDVLRSVAPGPTRDLMITHCSACPFATRADPDYPACKANLYLDPENREWYRLFEMSVDGDWVFPDPPPDWCPLRAGAVRIRVDAREDRS